MKTFASLFLLLILTTSCSHKKSTTELFAMEQQWRTKMNPGFDSTALEILNGYTALADEGDSDAAHKKSDFELKLKNLVEKDLGNLKRLDSLLMKNPDQFNETYASSLSDACIQFEAKHPCSSKSPNILLKGADLQRALNRKEASVQSLQHLILAHPQFKQIDIAYYFLGNQWAEMGQWEEAKKIMKTLIEKYPKSEFSKDAQILLNNNFQLPSVGNEKLQ